jgi:hypothetical protein
LRRESILGSRFSYVQSDCDTICEKWIQISSHIQKIYSEIVRISSGYRYLSEVALYGG